MPRYSRYLVPLNPGLSSWGMDSSPLSLYLQPSSRVNDQLAALQNSFRHLDSQFGHMERDLNSLLREYSGGALQGAQGFGIRPEIVEEGETKKYRLNVHVGENFSPENVKVSLKDRVMTVEAKNEQKSEDGNSRFYQEVSRSFTLPENIDLKEVRSVLTPEGVLKIEAPLPQEALPEPPKPKEIPIHLE